MKRILVTGGAGFFGSHFCEHVLKETDWEIVVLDRLSYAASGFDRLRDVDVFDDKRVTVLTADIAEPLSVGVKQEIGKVNYILHAAAETHVDNSIGDAYPFVRANVVGTYWMLEYARHHDGLEQFIQFSTDEVFGPAPEGVSYKEWDRYNCTNPYSASKASAEQLALAYANCYGMPLLLTRTMNMIGERQHPEKFVPLVIRKVLAGETVTIHADSTKTKPGKRHYIHCRNVADALLHLLSIGPFAREPFHIAGEREVDNLELARMIASFVGEPLKYELVSWHTSRPGHDLRYALDGSKMAEHGWAPPVGFEDSLRKTIKWTLAHPRWLKI